MAFGIPAAYLIGLVRGLMKAKVDSVTTIIGGVSSTRPGWQIDAEVRRAPFRFMLGQRWC